MKKLAVVIIGLLACTNNFANPSESFWKDNRSSSSRSTVNSSIDAIIARSNKPELVRRDLTLDEQALKALLLGTSDSQLSTGQSSFNKSNKSIQKKYEPEIDIPLPSGGFMRVRATDSSVLSPDMATLYPEIKTWRVQGVDDPSVTGRLDFTPYGFHGMLIMPDGDTVYIDPDKNSGISQYRSFSKKSNKSQFHSEFNCNVHTDHSVIEANSSTVREVANIPAAELITYRLALAGTAEYTNGFGGAVGAYASMATTINRVNEIYQRDLGVALQIVTDNTYAYTDSANDPYSNDSKDLMLFENMQNLYNNFGVNNYDIGHVFARGGLGGVAYVESVCVDSANTHLGHVDGLKGGGISGIFDPQGEAFSIEFVAHEMGHQLGAHHTFNSTQNGCGGGNRSTNNTSVEPGSGSTIMGYSGGCGTDNIQLDTDAMFHWASINEINNYTRVDVIGKSCGTRTATGFQKPDANAGSDGMVPTLTPFLLDGSATGGTSYTWDQNDSGNASLVDIDTGNNAIIRTLLPTADPDRYIPRLTNLFAGTSTKGEKLPYTVRDVNFTYVVRDNNGGIDTDEKIISVKNTGSTFTVTSHPNPQLFAQGQTINITWNVAGTNQAPVNCSNVDVHLLRVNGVKNILLENIDNDGAEQLAIPLATPLMTNARIMVSCKNQPFFNISSGDIQIQAGIDATPPVLTLNGSDSVDVYKGKPYVELGATATDAVDGAINVVVGGDIVDTSTVGAYTVTYTATDNAANTIVKNRTVNIILDVASPIISIAGGTPIDIKQGNVYVDAGATALDNADGVVAVVVLSNNVNTALVGTYQVVYESTDSVGNSAQSTRTVNVIVDLVAPVITITGGSPLNIHYNSNYIDAGATANDNVDGVVAAIVITNNVNTSVLGSYQVVYKATDSSLNSTTITRTVNVVDVIAPVITLNGSSAIELIQGTVYTELNATAIDTVDGAVNVTLAGVVNTAIVGTYTITYTATDNANNTSAKTRTVKVNAPAPVAPAANSQGGSMALLLVPLMLVGLRRKLSVDK